ncbi:MAG: hypothetical protein AAFY41_09510, partial [Bacteroidota bacterium]
TIRFIAVMIVALIISAANIHPVLKFLISVTAMFLAAEDFVRSSARIGRILGLPSFVIGATLCSLGTSGPEIFSGIPAVVNSQTELVWNNLIGSNITNICCVMVAATFLNKELKFDFNSIRVDLIFLLTSTLLPILVLRDRSFTFLEGLFLVFLYLIYLEYSLSRYGLRAAIKTILGASKLVSNSKSKRLKRLTSLKWRLVSLSVKAGLAIVCMYLAGTATNASLLEVADIVGIGGGEAARGGLSLVTSLTELSAVIYAVIRQQPAMGVGTVIGSNIINTLLISGLCRFWGPIVVPVSLDIAVLFLVISNAFLFVPRKSLDSWDASILGVIYLLFLANTFGFT